MNSVSEANFFINRVIIPLGLLTASCITVAVGAITSRADIPVLTIIAVGLFLLLLYYLYRSSTGYFVATFYLSAHFFSIVLGAAALEYYGYSPQIGFSGFPTGATLRLVLFYQAFLLAGLVSYDYLGRWLAIKSAKATSAYFVSYVVLIVGLILVFGWSFAVAGTAFDFNFDRIEYRRYAEAVAFGNLFGYENLISMVAAVGVPAGYYHGLLKNGPRKSRWVCNATILALILILVMTGEKLSTLLLFLSLFFGGLFAANPAVFRSSHWLRILSGFAVITAALVGVFFYLQDVDVAYSLSRRLNLQGQLSVYMDSRVVDGDVRANGLSMFEREVFGARIREYGSHGMSLLVKETSDPDVYDQFEESNAGFTDGFPAIAMFYFGSWYWLMVVPFGLLMGATFRVFFSRFVNAHPLFAIIGFVLLYRPITGAFINGALYSLIPASNTALLFAAIGLLMASSKKAVSVKA